MKRFLSGAIALSLFAVEVSAQDCWLLNGLDNTSPGDYIAQLQPQACSDTLPGHAWLDTSDDNTWPDGVSLLMTKVMLNEWLAEGFSVAFSATNDTVPEIHVTLDYTSGVPTPNLTPVSPVASEYFWTAWLDRDNQSGSGDHEYVGGFAPSDICENRLALEARLVGSLQRYQPGNYNTIPPHELAVFNAQSGLTCYNNDQTSGGCGDYEVRFLCRRGNWTGWSNRDLPSGSGDWELRNLFSSPSICSAPLEIRGRVKGAATEFTSAADAPDTLAAFNPNTGLVCRNTDQPTQPSGSKCSNYEVNFLCP